jgi:hypothetical protein
VASRRKDPAREARRVEGELGAALNALGLQWDVVGGKQVAHVSLPVKTPEVKRPAPVTRAAPVQRSRPKEVAPSFFKSVVAGWLEKLRHELDSEWIL